MSFVRRPLLAVRRALWGGLPVPAVFAAVLAVVAGGCSRAPEWDEPLRVADLVAARVTEAVPVAAGIEVAAEPVTLPVSIAASDVVRLTIRAAGDAELVKLAWRLDGDPRFLPFRAVSFPVVPDGEEHVYQVDLRREPYWTGTVVGVRLSTEGGGVRVVDVTGSGGGGRTTS
ncbi:MAG TPA: hypothetical protein VF100_09115, partial [Thermoanaerobaculia bacterium]